MTILKFPKKGDILKFEDGFSLRLDSQDYAEIPKGTLARVLKVRFLDESYTDEIQSDIVLLVELDGIEKVIKFNYMLHRQFVSIVPEGKLTELLYSKR